MVKYDYELLEKFNNRTEFQQYRNENMPFVSLKICHNKFNS